MPADTLVIHTRVKLTTLASLARFLKKNQIPLRGLSSIVRESLEILESTSEVEKFPNSHSAFRYLEASGILNLRDMQEDNKKRLSESLKVDIQKKPLIDPEEMMKTFLSLDEP